MEKSKTQLRRDMNALRGLFTRDPTPISMADISLRGGEGLHHAVSAMTETGELETVGLHGRVLYLPTDKLKRYRPYGLTISKC